MKKLSAAAAGLGAVVMTASMASAIISAEASVASASKPTITTINANKAATKTTLPVPVQGAGPHAVFMYVDTVTAGGSPKPAAACAITNLFQHGQTMAFRMWGVEAATGGTDLLPNNVLSAVVKIPGEKPIKMTYGPKDPFWTAAWTVPKSYPVGVVDFSVQVTTKKAGKVPEEHGLFSQQGTAPTSRLTIVAS